MFRSYDLIRIPGFDAPVPRKATFDMALTDLSAIDLARRIAHGDVSAVEAVDAHIERIEAVNPELNAVVVPRFEDARTRAREADDVPGDRRGPLHGVPITVKECFDVEDTPSTVGVTARTGHRATADAPLVARLRSAGAIVLGKTNVSQLLMYVETDNPVYGRTNNPWRTDRSCGGSSGGEGAIVAAHGSALGLGTDVGGSVRVPAHCCGISSLKPTPGVLSVEGTVNVIGPAARANIPDSAGILGRHVSDIRLALGALAPTAVAATPIDGIRIGYYEDDGYFPASTAIRRAVGEAATVLEGEQCRVIEFTPPAVSEALDVYYGLFGADRGTEWRARLEDGVVDPRIRDLLTLTRMPNPMRPLVATAMRLGGQARLAHTMRTGGNRDVVDLVRRRDAYRASFASAMRDGGVDVILCPPSSVPAFRHGSTKDLGPASVSYTCLYNLLGYPAGVVTTTSVCADETGGRAPTREKMSEAARLDDAGSQGLPIGVQVVAAPGRDGQVLTVMESLERGSTWAPSMSGSGGYAPGVQAGK